MLTEDHPLMMQPLFSSEKINNKDVVVVVEAWHIHGVKKHLYLYYCCSLAAVKKGYDCQDEGSGSRSG